MLTEDGKHLYVSYDEYHNLIEKLALKVYQSGWEFDTILCLARGGMRPGDILSRIFDVPLAIMSTSSYRANAGTEQGNLDIARYITTPRGEIAGKVLLVDDLADSGHTLRAVIDTLKNHYKPISELRSAVIWTKAVSVFTPDYSVEFLPTNPWIHQPFESYDSMRPAQLLEKVEALISMSDLSTRLIHHPYRPPEGFDAVAPGVHKASTVLFKDVHALRTQQWADKSGYTYGLHGTPTTFTLEERIATVEGGRFCVLAPSGLSALTLIDMSFLRQGDEVLIPDNAYGPGKAFAAVELSHWGITHRYYDPLDPADLASRLSAATRLVWIEAPGSITLEFPDVPALAAVVRSANEGRAPDRRILTALDNTWGAGIAFCPFDLGVDISMQALTKYPSGGADVLMGSVVTRDHALHHELLMCHMRLGLGVSGNDTELVLRGLASMPLRYQAQDATTRALATWMQSQPGIVRVLHPALPGSPGHEAWARDATAAACLFSAVFDERFSQSQIDAFCDRLRLFRPGWSWAGPISLCAPYNVPAIRTRPWAHKGGLVRFAIGLESADDLRADLAQALAALHA